MTGMWRWGPAQDKEPIYGIRNVKQPHLWWNDRLGCWVEPSSSVPGASRTLFADGYVKSHLELHDSLFVEWCSNEIGQFVAVGEAIALWPKVAS